MPRPNRSSPKFLVEANSAIMYGKSSTGLPSLNEFGLLHQFWKWLGMRKEDIDRLPWKKFQEFCVYIELINQKEAADHRAASSPAKHGQR